MPDRRRSSGTAAPAFASVHILKYAKSLYSIIRFQNCFTVYLNQPAFSATQTRRTSTTTLAWLAAALTSHTSCSTMTDKVDLEPVDDPGFKVAAGKTIEQYKHLGMLYTYC